MINILCYGDSNTFGFDAKTKTRLKKHERWPGVVQRALGEEYNIIEDGLPGRTTVWYDPVMNLISGADYLYPCLCAHQPLDMVVLMLGTNDLKQMFSVSAFDVFWGMERVVKIVKNFSTEFSANPPKIFIISPPNIIEPKEMFAEMYLGAEEKSVKLAKYYMELSVKYDALYLNAAEIIKPSPYDGLHIDANSHKLLGESTVKIIQEYFKKP
jgi:lysophospholipase L1-like esterase